MTGKLREMEMDGFKSDYGVGGGGIVTVKASSMVDEDRITTISRAKGISSTVADIFFVIE